MIYIGEAELEALDRGCAADCFSFVVIYRENRPSASGAALEAVHSTRGPIDGPALFDFRAEFERLEPLATGELDDPVDPTELTIVLDDGIGAASSARVVVRWTTATFILVARAVHMLWRLAYDRGGFEGSNAVENPP